MPPDEQNAPELAKTTKQRVSRRLKGGELTSRQLVRLAKWMPNNRQTYRKALLGLAGAMGAIKAQCLDCTGEDKELVRGCAADCCPLWRYRPYQNYDKTKITVHAGN